MNAATLPADAPGDDRRASAFAAGTLPAYVFLGSAGIVLPLLLAASGLRLAGEFGFILFALVLIVWFALCLRGRGLHRIAAAIEAWAILTGTCFVITLATFALGTNRMPLADDWLASADSKVLFGFDWPAAMLAFSRSGTALKMANAVYASIDWQPQLAIVVLSLTAAYRQLWHFVLSWITTLCLVLCIFAFCPALGAYVHFGIPAADVPGMLDPTPWRQAGILHGLRSGTLRLVDLGSLEGLVQFPSFHAGAAVLLGHAFWNVRILRWPFATLNGLMVASAVPIGGHYVVDLFAGIVVAAAGIRLASWIQDSLENPQRIDLVAR